MRITHLLLIITILSLSCKKKTNWNSEDFFEQAFELIKEESIKSNEINWNELKDAVKDSIKQFDSNEKVYDAIDYTLKLIDDGHSVFFPANTPNRLTVDSLSLPCLTSRIINKEIAYLKLTGFFSNDSLSRKYALSIRKRLLELDHNTNLSGWIIDLREHNGGKLTTECLGLSPLFKNPLIGISVNNKNCYKEIICKDNYFHFSNIKMDSLLYDSHLKNRNIKIAVLVSEETASAGEFLALAFKFQNNTKVFGKKTSGKTSHLRFFSFKSDAKLLLAVENFCDIHKNIISSGITPNVECTPEESLPKGIKWIKNAL